MASLTGSVAIITGAASGIGIAGANVFAAAGARLVLFDRDEEGLEAVTRRIRTEGHEVEGVTGDVTRPEDCQAMVSRAIDVFGGLDILWNNAGIAGPGVRVADYPVADWRRVIEVDLNGVFLGMQAALPVMLERGRGSIINTCSVAAQVAFPGDAAYCAAKAGVLMLTKTAAAEYAREGIRINCVLPGLIETPLLDRQPHLKARTERLVPMGRTADPEEVARCAIFLASDSASYVTGEALVIDGGYTLR